MTKMLSLEGVTLIYSSPDKINVILAWHCACHMKVWAWVQTTAPHGKSVQTTASSSANNPEHVSRRKSVCGQVHTHADERAPPRRHTEHEAFCCWCEILDCLCLLHLCVCALRCLLLSQFYELLCCSQKHERQRPKDELEAKGRMKSHMLNKYNEHEGGHKWREDGGSSVKLLVSTC